MQVELAQLRYRLPRLRGRGHAAQPAGRRRRRHRGTAVRARRSSRSTAGASSAASRKLERELDDARRSTRDTQRKARRRGARSHASRSSATRTPASRRCSTGSPTPACSSRTACSPPSTPPPAGCACPAARPCCSSDTVGFVRRLPAPAGRGVPVDARGGGRRRPARARRRRRRARPRAARSTRCARCCARSAPATCPSCSCSTRPTSPTADDVKATARRASAGGRRVGGHRRGIDVLLDTLAARLRTLAPIVELWCPTSGATCSPRSTGRARCWSKCTRRAEVGCERGCPLRRSLASASSSSTRRRDRGAHCAPDRPTARCARGRDRGVRRRGEDPLRQPARARTTSVSWANWSRGRVDCSPTAST